MPVHGETLAQQLADAASGLRPLLDEAEATWRARALADAEGEPEVAGRPGWRAFEDAFPTFYQFTNRPR
jgi:hypothetical protein